MKKILLLFFTLLPFLLSAQTDRIPTGATNPLSSTFKWLNPADTTKREVYIAWGKNSGVERADRLVRWYDFLRVKLKNDSLAAEKAGIADNNNFTGHNYFQNTVDFNAQANFYSAPYISPDGLYGSYAPLVFLNADGKVAASGQAYYNDGSLHWTMPHVYNAGAIYNGTPPDFNNSFNFHNPNDFSALTDLNVLVSSPSNNDGVGVVPFSKFALIGSGGNSYTKTEVDNAVNAPLTSLSSDPTNKYVFQGPVMAGSEAYNNGEDDIVQYNANIFIKGTSISYTRAEAANGQYVAIQISTDTARTWGAPITVRTPAAGNGCESVKVAVLGTRVILFYKELPALGNPYTSGTEYYTYCDNILSGSPTWATPTAINLNSTGGTALVFRIRKLGDGKLHVILWNNNYAENWVTSNGSSWSFQNTLYDYTSSTVLTGQVLTEPEFAYLGANKVLVIARNNAVAGSGSHPFQFYSTNNLSSLSFQGITNIGGVTDTTSKLQVPTAILADTARQLVKVFFISRPLIYYNAGITNGTTVAKIYGYVNSYASVIGNPKGYTTKFYYDLPLNQSTFVKGYPTIIPLTATRDILTFTSSNYELSNPASPGIVMNGWQAELLRTDAPNSLKSLTPPYSGLVQTFNANTGNYDYLYGQRGVSKNPDATLKLVADGELILKASAAWYDQKPALKVLNKNGSEVLRTGMANRQTWVQGGILSTTNGNFTTDSVAGANRSYVAGNGLGVLRSNSYFLTAASVQGITMHGSVDTITNYARMKLFQPSSAVNNVFTIGALNGGSITTSTLQLQANNGAAGINIWPIDSNGGRIFYYAANTGGASLVHSFRSQFSGSIRQTAILDSTVSTQSGAGGTTGIRYGLNRSGATNTGIDYAFTGGTNGATSFSMTYGGFLRATHMGGLGATPTIAAGAGAGTSPTVSISGTDVAGEITITTGTSPTASATIATITFASAYGTAPYVALTRSSTTAPTDIEVGPRSTGSFAITGILAASTTYKYNYVIIQ